MIVVRLTNHKTKDHIQNKKNLKLKGNEFFVNEHLSRKMFAFPNLQEYHKGKIK